MHCSKGRIKREGRSARIADLDAEVGHGAARFVGLAVGGGLADNTRVGRLEAVLGFGATKAAGIRTRRLTRSTGEHAEFGQWTAHLVTLAGFFVLEATDRSRVEAALGVGAAVLMVTTRRGQLSYVCLFV